MELDAVTANSPELAKAVHEQVAKSTKSLQAQVSQLTNKLNEIKNKFAGANKSSIQPKNKWDSAPQATDHHHRTKLKANAQKAAATAKDSSSSKKKTPRGKGNKTKNRKSKPNNSNSG
jgi:hypothetical protein